MKTLIASVILGGTFGTASATVESIDQNVMLVEIEVEVLDSSESVVAHLSFQDELVDTLPLLDRGDGTFGLRTELEPRNYVLVFETIGDGGERSEPVTLVQLGARLGPEVGDTTTTLGEGGLSDESERLLWLAVALGAGSLSLIAFWVLGSRDGAKDGDTVSTRDEDEAATEEE